MKLPFEFFFIDKLACMCMNDGLWKEYCGKDLGQVLGYAFFDTFVFCHCSKAIIYKGDMSGNSAKCCWIRDGNSGTVSDTRRVPDPNETGTGRVFLLIRG
jgi:hypothetical protein